MKTDAQLQTDVANELGWEPSVNAANVGVCVKDGVVTLTGHIDTFVEKFAIERAVQRVAGVRAMAVELDVRLAPEHRRSDTDIAHAVEAAFEWHALLPADRIQVKVDQGWVTLTGTVDFDHQRKEAEQAVRPLTGVVGVSNDLGLRVHATPADVSARIRAALARHAEREARHIEVDVAGSTVTLHGTVDSWAEGTAAAAAAWAAPGIENVVNELKVGSPA